jgi:hypothetical protein
MKPDNFIDRTLILLGADEKNPNQLKDKFMHHIRVKNNFKLQIPCLFFRVLICFIDTLSGQPVPAELWLSRNFSAELDMGLNWQEHSLFKPYELQSLIFRDSLSASPLWLARDRHVWGNRWSNLEEPRIMLWPGLVSQWRYGNSNTGGPDFRSLFLWGLVNYKPWYASVYIRAATRDDAYVNFTPYERPIDRAGMHAGEIDQAMIGYRTPWLNLGLGRGRQVWGPLLDNPVLSASSASYDQLSVRLFYKRLTAAFFSAYLESIEDEKGLNQIRYMSGRALQFRISRRSMVSVGEITVYYGENRPLDPGFSNPIILHLENEQNRRENSSLGNKSNAIWFLNMDCMLPMDLRISGSFAFDEFQLDQADRDRGRPDSMAGMLRMARSWTGNKSALIVYGQADAAGSYTYRHESPYACFASRSLPLAMPQGSDFYQWTVGLRVITPYRFLIETEFTDKRQGSNDLKQNMYEPYLEYTSIPFPSGEVQHSRCFSASCMWSIRAHWDASVSMVYERIGSGKSDWKQTSYYLRIQWHYPLIISI